jgi:DNA-nicking Smr family endonuclease
MMGASHSFRELDDLVLHLKGLVLVRKFRARRGADAAELDLYGAEIERARARLADFVARGAAARPSVAETIS